MNFTCIIYEKSQGLAIIKLNRTQVLNAMNKQMWLDIQAALEDAGNDSAIKVLVVTGSADKPVFKFQNSGIVCLHKDPNTGSWVIVWTLMPKIG